MWPPHISGRRPPHAGVATASVALREAGHAVDRIEDGYGGVGGGGHDRAGATEHVARRRRRAAMHGDEHEKQYEIWQTDNFHVM